MGFRSSPLLRWRKIGAQAMDWLTGWNKFKPRAFQFAATTMMAALIEKKSLDHPDEHSVLGKSPPVEEELAYLHSQWRDDGKDDGGDGEDLKKDD